VLYKLSFAAIDLKREPLKEGVTLYIPLFNHPLPLWFIHFRSSHDSCQSLFSSMV